MRIACYTLTRDRMAYSQLAFRSLKTKAGILYSHFVLDNGSTDGTQNWLRWGYKPHWLKLLPENIGIAAGANMALDAIFAQGDWDIVVKMDNDCEVVSPDILDHLSKLFADSRLDKFVLSPRVEGIDHQPERRNYLIIKSRKVGVTNIVGGLFHVVPGYVYKEFRYNPATPRGGYNDHYFCKWFRQRGGMVGYVEDLVVRHMDTTGGQVKVYPEYTKRKLMEMQEDLAAEKDGQILS